MKLNAGCGTHYADGWVNVDVWVDDQTMPDVVAVSGKPYPFEDSSATHIFLGHVIEHMPWPDVPAFITDMVRVAEPGAPLLIVGPDVMRTIQLWHEGKEPWYMVESTMEHQGLNFQPGREDKVWTEAAHHWNCHEERVAALLSSMGLQFTSYSDIIPNNPSGRSWEDPLTGITWPVVGKHHWQFALMVTAPTNYT